MSVTIEACVKSVQKGVILLGNEVGAQWLTGEPRPCSHEGQHVKAL